MCMRTREFTVLKKRFTSSSMHYDLELQEVSGRERSLQALPSATRSKQNKNVFVRLRRDEVYRSNRFVSSWNCNGVQHSIFATFIKLPVQQFNRQRVNYGVQTKTKHIITTHTHKHARAHVGIKSSSKPFIETHFTKLWCQTRIPPWHCEWRKRNPLPVVTMLSFPPAVFVSRGCLQTFCWNS